MTQALKYCLLEGWQGQVAWEHTRIQKNIRRKIEASVSKYTGAFDEDDSNASNDTFNFKHDDGRYQQDFDQQELENKKLNTWGRIQIWMIQTET